MVRVPFGCREGRHFSNTLHIIIQAAVYYGHSQSTLTSIANEVEAERGLGNAKLIPSPIANVFWEGDRFWTRGISYRNDQVAGNEPQGSKTARRAAVFDPGDRYLGGPLLV